MKIKFLRALVITIASLIIFLATTFIPALKGLKICDFLQGFSGGLGAGALIATISFYYRMREEAKAAEDLLS